MAKNTNAKIEFLNHISNREVLCVKIQNGYNYDYVDDDENELEINLTTGWTR